ncbi:M23 family metallopeptidase [Effusibacillus pohliae]|uniref:M23 family metallopeptidase n=1 Tax=Effusibacillus pohliae TaxID=232270 RepID=UPI00037814C7|nr:M23 family metallopeptidase [Effusibacillus pohliae]
MRFGKIGLFCSVLLLADAGQTLASGSDAPVRQPVPDLILQDQILQQQVKQVHQQLINTIDQIKQIDSRTQKTNSGLQAAEAEQTIRTMTERYTIVYLTLAAALESSTWPALAVEQQKQSDLALRNRLVQEKAQLETKEKQLSRTARTVSDQITKATGVSHRQGAIDNLNLEQLAGLLAWPVPSTKEVSSEYGWRELNGEIEFHGGIDVAAELGDPIHAAADGVVLFAGPAQGFGNWIVIRHESGLMTVYGHMYKTGIQVRPGQKVRQGQPIGRVGAAGESYGPHLHFGVATGFKDGLLETVNPWSFLQR